MAAEDKDLNRDPITDEPGSHPVGTGIGAAGGAMAGAAAGAIGGPLGMAVGGVVGAVVGGLAGKAAAEAVNPTAEEAHWRDNYTNEPYYQQGRSFDDYGPAYRLGVSGRTQHVGDWDTAEPKLASEWESSRDGSSLSWPEAQPASRAAWNRVDSYGVRAGDRMDLNRRVGPTMDLNGGMNSDMAGGGMNANMSNSSMGSTGGMGSTSDMGSTGSMATGSAGGMGSGSRMGDTGSDRPTGTAAMVGELQSAGNDSGDLDDVVDALNDLIETCKDGEYGFNACADQAKAPDLKSMLQQRAQDCRTGAQELAQQVRNLGGDVEDGGSVMGAVERGWVAVRTTLTSYDDKAVLEECERGEDNALARYRKALKKPLPANLKLIVERQLQGVQRNHDQVKMMRDQLKAGS